MPFSVDDSTNPADSRTNLNLIQSLNTIAFILKKITGQSSWKVPPPLSLAELGAKGDKGDKGDPGEPAPINHTHVIADVSGLQAAIDASATINHQHLPSTWLPLQLSSSWINYGTGYTTPQCRKFIGDLIEVKGAIKKSAALVTNEVIATLPMGYRPTEIMLVTTWASGGTSRLQVEPSGVIRLASGNNGGVGVSFFFGLN